MDSWKDWCRLCANLEASASSEVDENIKLTAISVFEVKKHRKIISQNLQFLFNILDCYIRK